MMIWIAVNNVRRKHNPRRGAAFWHDERSYTVVTNTKAALPQPVQPSLTCLHPLEEADPGLASQAIFRQSCPNYLVGRFCGLIL